MDRMHVFPAHVAGFWLIVCCCCCCFCRRRSVLSTVSIDWSVVWMLFLLVLGRFHWLDVVIARIMDVCIGWVLLPLVLGRFYWLDVVLPLARFDGLID